MLVSIITPVLNGEKYISQCMDSVLSQTYPNIEHIVVDGYSTDKTISIIADYGMKYLKQNKSLVLVPSITGDKGACDAWNKGWGIANGEILGWIGSDDTYEPNAIQTVITFFERNVDACFVFGGCNFIDGEGEIIGKHPASDFTLKDCINSVNSIPAPSAFYKRELIERIGALDTSIHSCDRDYWIRVGKSFKIYRIDDVLANFRRHEGSISVKLGETKMVYVKEDYLLNRRYHGSILSPVVLAYWIYRIKLDRWLFPILRPLYHRYIKR